MNFAAQLRKTIAGYNPNWLAALVFLISVSFVGGSSRVDTLAQPAVQGAAFLALALAIIVPGGRSDRSLLPVGLLLGAAVLLALIHVVPLPPSLWASLPGRAFYLEAAAAAGLPQPWRPLALAPDLALTSLFSLVVPVAMLVLLSRISPRERATLTGPALALVVASAILGLAQISGGQDSALRWYEVANDRSAVGFFANRNHQALLLASGLPIAAAWALQDVPDSRVWTRGWIALGICALLLMIQPTTGSRAGLALAGIGLLVAVAMSWRVAWRRSQGLRRRQRRITAGAAAAGVAALIGALLLFGRNESFRRLADLDSADDVRAQALPTILAMTREFFPTGIGFGSFDPVFRRFEPFAMLSTEYLNQAHNDAIQVVLEGGLAAALIVAALVGWWLWMSVRAWRAAPSVRVQAARAGSAIVGMTLLASIVDYPLRTSLAMAWLVLAAAWLTAATGRSAELEPAA